MPFQTSVAEQMDLRAAIRRPGVLRKIRALQCALKLSAEQTEIGNLEVEVFRCEGRNVRATESQQAKRRSQSCAVGGVSRTEILFAQMDKGSGDLDETFVETSIGVRAIKPEVLKDVMGLVVFAGVEKTKEQFVARRMSS